MKKKLLASALLLLFLGVAFAPAAMAGGESGARVTATTPKASKCPRYPILLVHGAGFRDKTVGINYWGRIPKALEAQGAKVFYGGTDAWGTLETNAATLKKTIERILVETNSKKVNIIAHSKGGLECRYLISALGIEHKIASLTTISTPHRGSVMVEKLANVPDWLYKGFSEVMNVVFGLQGDDDPDFYNGSQSLTPAYMEKFNAEHPDKKGVYYQSFAGYMEEPKNDIILSVTSLASSKLEGENDGIVAVDSAKWANYGGVLQGANGRGVSHMDEVDFRRRDVAIKPVLGATTVREFYIAVAADLAKRGY